MSSNYVQRLMVGGIKPQAIGKALTIAVTFPALAGYMEREAFLWLFLIIFVFILKATFSLAINIILMPRLGARIWCKFLCPQGLLLGILSSIGRFALVRDDHRCKSCGSCEQVIPQVGTPMKTSMMP